jgi:hypothetical protein
MPVPVVELIPDWTLVSGSAKARGAGRPLRRADKQSLAPPEFGVYTSHSSFVELS